MKKSLRTLTQYVFWSFTILIFQSCNDGSSPERAIRHVVIIGVDGMSPDGILKASAPNMRYFMEHGAYTLQARAVLPSSSSSNWASMIMGAGPEQHGITSNGWERDDFILPAVSKGKEDIFPTIFGVVREQIPEAEIGAVYHWDGFERLFEKSTVNYAVAATSERDAADKASAYIIGKKPLFLFVHMDHVDGAGHTYGHGTPEYYDAVSRADTLIGQIVEATKKGGIFEETLFIISSDHGGIGKGHGGETLAEVEIPFILFGKNVKSAYKIQHPVFQYDNAATVAFALGVEQPYAWIGKPIRSAFEGFPDLLTYKAETAIGAPVILPASHQYAPAGGLYVDEKPQVEIQSGQPGDTVRYTMDGKDPDATSSIYQEPFLLQQSAVIKARSFSSGKESPVSKAFFRLASSRGGNGVNYHYYEGKDWHLLPDFEKIIPVTSGKVYEFRIDSIPHRHHQFAIRFDAFLKIDMEGEYTFYTNSDDGSKLYIDGQEVVNNDGGHGTLERSGKITLSPGIHSIKVTYFNEGGGSWIDVFYKGPGVAKQIIPADVLHIKR